MRSPRVVVDYHVDRREVQVQRCTEPTRTNSPITFVSSFRSSLSRHTGPRCGGSGNTKRRRRGGATPLPIPNREVKPACADGTARKGGRAGGCRLWGATTDRSMVTSCRRRPFLFCTPSPSSFLPSHFPSFLLPPSFPDPPALAAAVAAVPSPFRPGSGLRASPSGSSSPSLRPRKPEANARVASTCFLEGKSTAYPLGTLLQGMPVCFLHGKSTYCRQPFMPGNVVLQHFADNNFSDEVRKPRKP